MNNFKAKNQPEGILAAWSHFKRLGVSNSDIGTSQPSREITIRTKIDTVYITRMARNKTYRITTYSSASTKSERTKLAKEYVKIEDAIESAEKALGF